MTRHRARNVTLVLILISGVLAGRPHVSARSADLPAKITDKDFWDLSEQISEPDGVFQSDNFLSNERGYQVVIPDLIRAAKPGRVYLGVGPEQNFPYILALKPQIAIIFDVRRGNLHEHLLYKALFEMSSDRVEFLGRLFSRKPPDGVTTKSTANELMAAYQAMAPSEDLYKANLQAVSDWLTKKHGFALHPDDLPALITSTGRRSSQVVRT
jgi:hypothetical protein